MRKLCKLSVLAFIIFLFTLQVGVTSCTKDKTLYDTVTVVKRDTLIETKRDTLVIKDTALSLQILTANSWKLQEVRGVKGGNIQYYVRGGYNNTESFDNEYIVFRQDKTGTYFENSGRQDPITWDFANDAYTKITWTLYNTPATFIVTWDSIRFKNNGLSYDQYYTDGNTGANAHSQEIRIPK